MGSSPKTELAAAPLAQQAFFFVTEEERAAQDLAYQIVTRARRAQAHARHCEVEDTPQPVLSLSILEAPLFQVERSEVLGEDPLAAAADLLEGETDEQYDDTDEAQRQQDTAFLADRAVEFLDWLLQRNLEFLATCGNALEKKSVIEWVFAPDIDGYVFDYRPGGCGRELPLYSKRLPFSFQWICAQIGLDADSLRQELLWHLRQAEARAAGRARSNIGQAARLAEQLADQ